MIYIKHPIELLSLTKAKENQFIAKGLTSVEDIAYFFPRKYMDFREVCSVKDTEIGKYYALQGRVIDIRSRNNIFTALVREDKEAVRGIYPQFSVVWFGTDFYIKQLEVGKSYVFCGRVGEFAGEVNINSPLAFGQARDVCKIMPVYSKISGMSNDYLQKQIKAAISFLQAAEKQGEKELLAKSLRLMDKYAAVRELHQPTDNKLLNYARQRIAFEHIYDFYAELKKEEIYNQADSVKYFNEHSLIEQLIRNLPFALTADQKTTIENIIEDARYGKRINTLVSGDVGCGKTMIAILAAVLAYENGCQTIVMAPTLVLAQQHYTEIEQYTSQLGIQVGLLSTATKKRERNNLLKAFSEGELDILVGTHSVLSDEVNPHNLGLTIVDEEHKFGVKQKECLEKFSQSGVHHISMTATPIPRSVAMTVYGRGVTVLPIKTMPIGRTPIETRQCFKCEDAFEMIFDEVQNGRQAFIICPLIHESNSEKFQNVMSVEIIQQKAKKYFAAKPNKVRLGVISGDMKQADIMAVMDQFAAHKFDVLISTTIVEVGVNIPNATVMAVMSAERFGLAALHQLRGRVGRGNFQSYCLLCSEKKTERLDIMCSTNDGFEIAERDLQLRGSGDILGEAQSGQSNIIQLIMQRPNLAQIVKDKIFA